MKFFYWLTGPQALLTLVALSYFWLLFSEPFQYQPARDDMLILGIGAFIAATLLFRARFSSRVNITAKDARSTLIVLLLLFVPVDLYVLSASDWAFAALVDARFTLTGFGAISSLYYVGSIVGSAVCVKSERPALVILFLLAAGACGFIAGGKSFAVPMVFGFALAARLRWLTVSKSQLTFGLLFSVGGFYLAVAEMADSALVVLAVRLELAADAIRWLASMSYVEITNFSVDWVTFLLDILLRFVGARINPRSVGSEIAFVVAGDDSGGGPNPLLPVIAYLVTGGSIFGALLFMCATLLAVWWILSRLRKHMRKGGYASFFCAVAVALSPGVIIDMISSLQQAFWLILIAVSARVLTQARMTRATTNSLSIRWRGRTARRAAVTAQHRSEHLP